MEEAQVDRPVRSKQPYLRRGSGWETRVQAAKEGRRYRPKGGTVHDYGSEQLGVGAAPHKAPSKVAPTRQKGSSASPTKSARSGTQSAKSAQSAGRSPAKKAGQLGGPSVPRLQTKLASQQSQKQRIGSFKSQTDLAGTGVLPANAGLLHPASKSAWAEDSAEQDLELQEFCALESEVLREVSNNTVRPGGSSSPGPAASAKAWGLVADQCSSAKWPATELGDGSGAAGDDAEEEDDADVFEHVAEGSTWGGNSQYSYPGERARRVSFADSSLHCPAGSRTVLEEDEEEGELVAQSELIEEEIPMKPASSLVQKFFFSQKAEKAPLPKEESTPPEELLRKQVEELEEQVKRLNEERSRVGQQRKQVEEAKSKLEQEKAALEKRKAEELAQVEALKAEELRKLQRDRRVLEKQSRALLKLPTKREKEEVQALEAVLEKERQNGRGKDARHKLTVDRLRRQILELQEQVQFLEAQRLQEWQGGQGSLSPGKHGTLAAGTRCGQQAAGHGKKTAMADARPCQSQPQQQQQVVQPPSNLGGCGAVEPLGGASAAVEGCEESDPCSDCEESGCVVAEELGQDMLTTTLPTVRVSVHHQRQQQQPMQPDFCLGHPTTSRTAFVDKTFKQGASEQAGQQTSVQLTAATAPPDQSHGGSMSVMQKATSALSHFNQLKESLLQNGALQQKLSSRLGSLQASPVLLSAEQDPEGGHAALHVQRSFGLAEAGGPVHKVDDLRMLGRMLTTSATHEVPLSTSASYSLQQEGTLVQQPQLQPAPVLQPAGPGTTIAPNRSLTSELQGQPDAAHAAATPTPTMVVSERQYDGGRVEKVFASGVKVQEFPNGSRKQQWPDGRAMTRFGNGDVKVAWPNGRVDYYYGAVDCWQVTHAGGVEVFFFASGQVEAHHPGGIKEIIFPEGGMRKVLPDGRELVVTALHLSKEIKLPRPEAPVL